MEWTNVQTVGIHFKDRKLENFVVVKMVITMIYKFLYAKNVTKLVYHVMEQN